MQKIRRLYIIDCQQESISRQFESATRAPEVPVTVSFVLICSGLRVLLALLRGRSEAQARVVYIINHKVAWLLCRSRDDGEAAPKSKKGKTMTSDLVCGLLVTVTVTTTLCKSDLYELQTSKTLTVLRDINSNGFILWSRKNCSWFTASALFLPCTFFNWVTFELIAPTSLALNIASRPISCALTNSNTALLELD